MSFAKQAAVATIVVAGCVLALVAVGRKGETPNPDASTGSGGGGAVHEAKADDEAPAPAKAPANDVRDLVPPGAWLVADFQGDLTGQKPFADQEGLCASVPAPERVAMAVLPPKADGQEPDLMIAARHVNDVFWGCARDRIVRAGGTALAQNERFEVLRSPSGVVARGPVGSMIFLTSETHLESALSVLSELTPGAASTGPHAELHRRMHAKTKPEDDAALEMTLSLPDDWLAAVGQERTETPLRFIKSAYISASPDGSARGGIDCDEAGCAEVLSFLERAQTDLVAGLGPSLEKAIESSLEMSHSPGSGLIDLRFDPSGASLTSLLGQFLGEGGLPR